MGATFLLLESTSRSIHSSERKSRQYTRTAVTMKDRGDAVEHSTILDPEKINATADPAAETDTQSGDDLDGPNSQKHVFSDPIAAEHWRNVYEKAGYENRHRFDPEFTWTAEDERKLVRRVDLRIMTWAVSDIPTTILVQLWGVQIRFRRLAHQFNCSKYVFNVCILT